MKVLVLVDLQNDFCPDGALGVPGGDEVISVANQVQRHFDLIIATKDWHPADHGSFASNHEGRKPGDVIDLNGLDQVLWPVHCVQGTDGAAFARDLDTSRFAKIFCKGTDPAIDSYSAFYDNDRRTATGLSEYLKERGVIDVYVMGLATDYCVKFTVLDALRDGFNAYVIEDGCRGVNLEPGDVDRAIDRMRAAGAVLIDSGDIGT